MRRLRMLRQVGMMLPERGHERPQLDDLLQHHAERRPSIGIALRAFQGSSRESAQ